MKQIIVYSCVTEPETEMDLMQVIRFSLSKDIDSTPTKKAKRFKGRVAASYVTDNSEANSVIWNSCRSGVQPCRGDGTAMAGLRDDMVDWLTGAVDIRFDEDPYEDTIDAFLVRR